MAESKPHKDAMVWMSGDYSAGDILFRRAIVRERMGRATEMTVEFQSTNKAVSLNDILGKAMRVHVETLNQAKRSFTGICISVENLGFRDGFGQYVAEVRPWFWLLTRARNNRIFQEMTAIDVIKKVFSDHSFSDFEDKTTETYEPRTYCVQYRETDFDFVSRLMEQEGIYYYFKNDLDSDAVEKMVLCDGAGGHAPAPKAATVEYHARDTSDRRREDTITEWAATRAVTTGKVTLDDFDFTAPKSDLKVVNQQEKGDHSHKSMEFYDYPGRQTIDGQGAGSDIDRGERLARVRMDAQAVLHLQLRGASGVRTLGTGMTFKLKEHPDKKLNDEYLVTGAVHYVQVLTDVRDHGVVHDIEPRNMEFPENFEHFAYASTLDAIPAKVPFRTPQETPWPEIGGMQTATVVGPSGEEIHTDKYGRIKVQFHWDRDGKLDDKSSCWLRVVTPWSGTNWGMIAIPRVKQEVAVQFEEGDPDRPICTGMLYNEDTMPPFTLPDNKTQSGIRTDSTKGVKDSKAYNELMFEDKADSELVRMQAQKDHEMLVKNKSSVTIGFDEMDYGEHDDEFSLTTVVKQNVSQLITDGDRFVTLKKGSETTLIEKGDMTVDVSMGKIAMTAKKEIKLTVGESSITIKPAEVSIQSPVIKITADGMAEMKSPATTVKGDGMLTLKGGITMIN